MQELRFQQQLSSLLFFAKAFPWKTNHTDSLLWNPPQPLGLWIGSEWVDCCKLQDRELSTKLQTCPDCVIIWRRPLSFPGSFPLHLLLARHQCQAVASYRTDHIFPYCFSSKMSRPLPRDVKRTPRELNSVGCSRYAADSHASAFAKYVP